MPSKKRKYNARFPAGRIKKIMQTDEEVGKVAQAVPIIISVGCPPRTLELFVQSLLSKALQVTMARNAKTLSPSHLKQCILAESRFDFLHDLVKNIPDVSAAEEKEMMSAENSPNSSRFSDMTVPRRVGREDSNSSSSSDVRLQNLPKHGFTSDTELRTRTETITSATEVVDLTKKSVVAANFYQETLNLDEIAVPHQSVIQPNPSYSLSQPSTSTYANLTSVEPLQRVIPKVTTPVTPILNIDFSKNITNPEIKVLDSNVAIGVSEQKSVKVLSRQNSKQKIESRAPSTVNLDYINSGNLQIDEDYDT